MIFGSVNGHFGLGKLCMADFALDFNFGAFSEMVAHLADLYFELTVLAGNFDLGYNFAGNSGRVVFDILTSAARTVVIFLHCVLHTLKAVYFGTTGAFDCLFGEFEAEGAGEVLFKIHPRI